ncbi:dynamin family protein [Coniochaeta sp. PMI_546]|nr:dynamin family protein [Coniochaeta sp. PMI_546]
MAASLDSALDAQELANEQRTLLDLIDKLQFAQLDNVKLPQIVVVGDQSAGKSSVLEAITGTPFPRDAGACTRFATEIRLRRSPEPSIEVSIIPDKARNFKEQEMLRQFGGMVHADVSFDALMRSAVDLIAPKNMPGRFAAKDILVVEKRGPDMPLLTLVDLPGLVKNANNDQSLEDIKTIEVLSDRYMKSSRTIILAVVGGNSDYVQAPILTKARHFDPDGSRTIGVLTKPDLTEGIGLEDKFIELVTNRDRRNAFLLGWFVLVNPGPREPGQPWPSAEQRRQTEENFFSRGKWSVLPENMRGASALKQKLSTQLQRHIGRYVKTLRKQIQRALDECDGELKSLGTGKDTPEEMRIELVELFSASKELVIPAVHGFYKNPPRKAFFRVTADPRGTPAQNLRARATEENDRFAARIRARGRKYNFADGGKHDYACREVEILLCQVRGSEFPMDSKPRAVYMLFQSYSEYWPKLAQEHKDNLGVVCNEFLSELIDFGWPRRMREPLRRHFLDPQMKALMDKAQQELELLTQDMNLEVQPYDPEYEERLRNWHAESTRDGAKFSEAEEVLEKMLIYYELAAKTFIRNTITQVVERHLLQGMYGIFNSVAVMSMSNEVVEAIAAENKETRDRRQTLKVQKKAIEEAKDICASLAMRKELRMYAEDDRDNAEDTSDEEGPKRHSSNSPTTARGPPVKSTRRTSRQQQPPREEAPTTTPRGVAATQPTPPGVTGDHHHSTPTRPEVPRVSVDAGEEYYATSKPPSSAPPPPPRPDKVRAGEQQRQQQESGLGSNNPYIPAEPRTDSPGGWPSDYVQSAARRQQRNGVLGRA